MNTFLFNKIILRITTVLFMLIPMVGMGQTTQTFNTNGSWTVPCGVTSVTVQAWGGGGGGAGDSDNSTLIHGSGGGAGGYCTNTFTVTPGQSIPYVVGVGGAAGAVAGAGGNGTASTFLTLSAGFGTGGSISNGAGGVGGGGSGGTVTNGSNGAVGNSTAGFSGAGGVAANMGGIGFGAARNTDGDGISGTANTGGGGGGAWDDGGSNNTGGAGGSGRIIITYTGPNAGPDQTLAACATTATLAANAPAGSGTGTWTCVSGCAGVSITTPTSPTSGVTGLVPGTNTVLQWTWTGGGAGCTSTNDQVQINTVQGIGCWVYCSSAPNSSLEYIQNVSFGTINNTTVGNSYSTYSSPCAAVTIGSSYNLCVTVQCAGTEFVTAVFDWNNDGDFSDAGEAFPIGSTSVDGTVLCASITIPVGAVVGNTTMRIIESWNAAAVSPYCSVNTYGEIENYCVTILGCLMNTPNAGPNQNLAACVTSTTLAGNVITNGTGSWSISSGAGTITTPSSPTSGVTNLGPGTNSFTWTATPTDVNCPVLTSSVNIVTSGLPTAPNAGPDTVTCNASFTLAGNAITVGTGAWSCTANCGGITFGSPTSPTSTVNGLIVGTPVTLTWTATNGACVSTDNVVITRVAGVTASNAGPDQAVCINTTATLAGNIPTNGTGTWTSTYGFIASPTTYNTTVSGLIATGAYTFTYTVSAPGCASSVDQMILTVNPCDPTMNTVTCGTPMTFTDGAGNYGNNADIVTKYCPSVPGQYVTATFTEMNAVAPDNMIVLNGSFSTAPIIDEFNSLPTINGGANTITSSASDGCLTFIFVSNNATVASGWTATINCTPTASTTNVARCDYTDCLGGCMRTICGTPSTVPFSGGSIGAMEINDGNNGCWAASAGENCSNWFYLNPTGPGTLAVNIYVNNGLDQDFLLWDGYRPTLSCPAITGNDPLRCNFAGASDQGTGFNDVLDPTYTSYEPSVTITQAQINAGYYLIMLVVSYGNSCPQASVNITFSGTATMGCTPPISALPIELVSFVGSNLGRSNLLNWSVASQINNDYFTLEKSNNGTSWEVLGQVAGAGTTQTSMDYEFVDENPFAQITYYRLKQTDFDGAFKYSEIISISTLQNEEGLFSNLYPNPSNESFYFNYSGNNLAEPIKVSMINSAGKIVSTSNFENFNKSQGLNISTKEVANGYYQVIISQGDKKEMKKISVIH